MALRIGKHSQKPRIGVTGNHRFLSPSWFCIRLAVYLAGGKPIRISIHHTASPESLDGLIVSGGDDIHPSLYGGKTMAKANYDQPRDELEQRLIKFSLQHDLPMLGICRGYQLINVTLGGRLFADIRDKRRNTSNFGTILPRKTALVEEASNLHRIAGSSRFKVNSLHHQAVEKVGDGMSIVAHDLDNFIQATECNDRQIVGVQWHPEYLAYQKRQRKLFEWLVGAASGAP